MADTKITATFRIFTFQNGRSQKSPAQSPRGAGELVGSVVRIAPPTEPYGCRNLKKIDIIVEESRQKEVVGAEGGAGVEFRYGNIDRTKSLT